MLREERRLRLFANASPPAAALRLPRYLCPFMYMAWALCVAGVYSYKARSI
ncbi:hypothetical protein [Pyrobaculum ferrireducens]|uniref:Uncharacterized protein n=1 Tax=Pyrobaculum ferrireducens TaxID=1104324 RepID=G7VCR0_9CREN|nr:hypothetical protein [Pyrobaculum ferrireducens]AET33865.1 hypothetical protein P186_2479 [Pyrobaculum ferrireducens]